MMTQYESSIDYSRVIENEELDIGPDNDNLELAHRWGNDMDDTVITVSISDDQTLEIVTSHSQFRSCIKWGRVPLAVYLLLFSAFLLATAVILLHVYLKQTAGTSVQSFLLVLRSIGVLTFIGQLSYIVAWRVSFLDTGLLYFQRSKHKFKQEVSQCLTRFITCTILDEVAVRNYFQQVNIASDEEELKNLASFIESADLDRIVSSQLTQIYESSEGPILDMLGVNKSELTSHCNSLLQQAVCRVFHQLPNDTSRDHWRRPEAIRSHVAEIISLQLQSLSWGDLMKLSKSIAARQFDRQALIIFICTTFAGCLTEVLRLVIPLH